MFLAASEGYLDLLFFFRCLHGEILFDISQFVQFSSSCTRRGSSRLDLSPSRADLYLSRLLLRAHLPPVELSPYLYLLLPSSRNLKPFFSLVFSILMPRMISGLGV